MITSLGLPQAISPWPDDPRPVRRELAKVEPLAPGLLPEALRGWLVDIAERVSCPLEYPAMAAIVAMGIILGRKVAIRPKRFDDWTVVPNLWGAIVGRPGTLKSPALNEALRPLREIEEEALREHERARADFTARRIVARASAEVIQAKVTKAARQGMDPAELLEMARAASRAEADAAEPTERRLTTQDPTVEALGELLRDNPNIGVIRDELTGLLRSMEKPDRGADRAFYLEAWDGNRTTFQYDRIGRGKVTIKNPTVSILGSIQPGPLRALLREVARGESGDDGLIFRFQVLFWPDLPAKWTNVDRWPDGPARRRVDRLFRAFDALIPSDVGAEPGDGGVPPYLRFDDDAQPHFDAWRNHLENHQLRGPDGDAMLEAHLAKYRKLVPGLALLFHLADALDPDRPPDAPRPSGVSLASLERAVRWHEVLQSHARRVYGSLDAPDIEAAGALLKKLSEGQLPSPFSYRDVYTRNWGKLDDALAVRRAVAFLEELGWLQTVEVRDTGGAPRADVYLHPRLARKGEDAS